MSQAGHVTEKFLQRSGPSCKTDVQSSFRDFYFKSLVLWLLKAEKNVDCCCLKVIWNFLSVKCLCKCCFKRVLAKVNLERTVAMFEFVFLVGVCC